MCGPVVMESDGASAAILTLNASRTAESSDKAVFLSCGPSSDNLRLHASIRVMRASVYSESSSDKVSSFVFMRGADGERRLFGVQA